MTQTSWMPTYAVQDPQLILLNQKKHTLEGLENKSAADWIDLAAEYLENGSRANYAYCIFQAEKLEVKTDPDDLPVEIDQPEEPPFAWQVHQDQD